MVKIHPYLVEFIMLAGLMGVMGIVIPILWITKEIMSRGPQGADME
jgi:hypothetical protein